MKYLLPLLSLTLLYSQELEVEGDLKVTGTFESTTIDSLNQVIQDLQSQLSALQGGVSQRVIDFTFETGENVTLDDILPDYDLDWALIRIINIIKE